MFASVVAAFVGNRHAREQGVSVVNVSQVRAGDVVRKNGKNRVVAKVAPDMVLENKVEIVFRDGSMMIADPSETIARVR